MIFTNDLLQKIYNLESLNIKTVQFLFADAYSLEATLEETDKVIMIMSKEKRKKIWLCPKEKYSSLEIPTLIEKDFWDDIYYLGSCDELNLDNYRKKDISIGGIYLKEEIMDTFHSNLRRQIRKGEDHIQSIIVEDFDPETFKVSILKLTKFLEVSGVHIIDPLLMNQFLQRNIHLHIFKKITVKTTFGIIEGIITEWDKVWTADYHWSFSGTNFEGISYTSLFHWAVIKEAMKRQKEVYSLGFMYNKSTGLGRYKNQWNPTIHKGTQFVKLS